MLHFFYTLNFINEHSLKYKNENDWKDFLQNLKSKQFSSIQEKVGYKFYDLTVVILNRVFGINISKLIIDYGSAISKSVCMSLFNTLPYLHSTPKQLVEVILLVTNGIKAEDNYLNLNQSIIETAKNNTTFGMLLIKESEGNPDKRKLFVACAFVGITQSLGIKSTMNILEDLLSSKDEEKIKVGLRSLSLLHGMNDNPAEVEDKINPLLKSIEDLNNDALNAELIFCYGLLIDKFSLARRKLIDIPKRHNGKDVFFALARIVNMKIKNENDEEWLNEALTILSHLSNHHIGTYKQVELALCSVLNSKPNMVFKYLEAYIEDENNELKNIEGFKQIFSDLADNNINLLQEWITLWLNNDNYRFHHVISKVSQILWLYKKRNLELDKSIVSSLKPYDLEFILYKIVGYIHSKEHLESLVYSVLKYKQESTIIDQIIIQLFCYYIIYNYPASIKFLQIQKTEANEQQKKFIETVERYYGDVFTLPKEKPKELAPSPDRLQLLFNQSTKDFGKSEDMSPFREASFLDMVTKVSLKTGNNFFSRDNYFYGTNNRYTNKSTMGHFSSSFELPSGEFTDPVGQEYNRYIWRKFKRRTV